MLPLHSAAPWHALSRGPLFVLLFVQAGGSGSRWRSAQTCNLAILPPPPLYPAPKETPASTDLTCCKLQALDLAEADQDALHASAYKLRRSIEGEDLPVGSWTEDLPTTWQHEAAAMIWNSVSDSSRPDDSIAGMAAVAESTAEIIQHASDRQRDSLAKAAEEERGSRRDAAKLEIMFLEDEPLESVLPLPAHRQMRRLLRE